MSDPTPSTTSGLPLRTVYGPADVPSGWVPSLPGAAPFTRGALPGGYRTKLWTMRQYAGFSSAAESNRRYRFLLVIRSLILLRQRPVLVALRLVAI